MNFIVSIDIEIIMSIDTNIDMKKKFTQRLLCL